MNSKLNLDLGVEYSDPAELQQDYTSPALHCSLQYCVHDPLVPNITVDCAMYVLKLQISTYV